MDTGVHKQLNTEVVRALHPRMARGMDINSHAHTPKEARTPYQVQKHQASDTNTALLRRTIVNGTYGILKNLYI